MYVRSKRNKSGSYSIQIISKSRGRYKVVESIGVSRTDSEKARLESLARDRIKELEGQMSLGLFTEQDASISSYLSNSAEIEVKNAGPELVLGKVFDSIGFGSIEEPLFRHITLSRLVYPVSKLKTVEYLVRHHGVEFGISSVYRFLDRFYKDYREKVERIVYDHSKKVLKKVSVVFYDMTTLYYESEEEDDLRKIGFSKDGKFRNPQIMLGLLVGENGFPLGYDIFEGSKFEGHTLIPVIEGIEKKYGLSKPIVVADSGLLSKDNIRLLTQKGYRYIIGARIKNEASDMKATILKRCQSLGDGCTRTIKRDNGTKLVISYSHRRAKKDKHNRDKGVRRLEKGVSGGKLTKDKINNRGYNKFLVIKDTINVEIDKERIKEDEKWDGLKGYNTNCSMSPKKLIAHYNELWKIEKAFRISKTDLRIRPIFHRKRDRIEAHLCIAFAAYAVYKELERLLEQKHVGISPARAIELSKTIFKITFQLPDSKQKISIFNKIDEMQKKLIDILN